MPNASIGEKGCVDGKCAQSAAVLHPEIMWGRDFRSVWYHRGTILENGLLKCEIFAEEEAAIVGNVEEFVCVSRQGVGQVNGMNSIHNGAMRFTWKKDASL
jgi:hypothetical protein